MIERYCRPAMKKVWSDDNAFDLWLRVEIAACQAWSELGVVHKEDMDLIRQATFNRTSYDKWFDETKHDLVSFTRAVSETLGSEARWIHYGLTSNDVKDTALAMQMTETCDLIDADVARFMDALTKQAIIYKYTPCIGRSHGVHAEPMSFGLKLVLWWSEMKRNRDRIAGLRSRVAVGMISGPVGTYAGIPPEIEDSVCRQLNLTPVAVSNQVIQRDRHAEFVQTLAILGASLEKIATEIRALQRTEVREVQEPFGEEGYVTKGSSSMPHKRNPELSERVCGLARLVRGHAMTALDDVALWHERDISHSSAERMILPDASLAIDYMLDLMTGIIGGMVVDTGRMMYNLELTRGLVFSPRVMLALVEAGMDRTEAYELVQKHSMHSWDTEEDFRDILRNDPHVTSILPVDSLDSLFDYSYYLTYVDDIYTKVGLNG
ncbi:MAG: adenylosuccinate lyase [Chloroflexota bacterium]|nr:adenylosuccinate lyase [Chloroflexota bacterium]